MGIMGNKSERYPIMDFFKELMTNKVFMVLFLIVVAMAVGSFFV